MNIQIGTAGLAEELEVRLSLACELLAAPRLRIDIHAWKGGPCDMLIVDLECGYGRLAYEVATRRKLRVLAFGRGDAAEADGAVYRIDRDTPSYEVSKILAELLLPRQSQVSIS